MGILGQKQTDYLLQGFLAVLVSISEGAGGFPNTRYSPCLMSAFPMVVLYCTSALLSTGKFFAGNLATDCFQKVRWHLPTAVERAFSIPVSLEGGGLLSYHYIMHSQWCHSLWRNLLFHMVKFCLPNQTHLQDWFNERLQCWSFNIIWSSSMGKKLLIL